MRHDSRAAIGWSELVLAAGASLLGGWCAAAGAEIDFEQTAGDVLLRRCVACHGSAEPSGGLDLSSAAGLQAGGDGGAAVVPGDAGSSRLFQRLRDGEMPPEQQGRSARLPAEEIDRIAQWIAAGARWPAGRVLDPYERTTATRAGRDWWSLQPLTDAAPPERTDRRESAPPRHPIDAFLDERLLRAGIAPAPEADRRTLLRRLSYDLTGLPPTVEEIDAFLADGAPDAYERQVDRLLQSPHFGERQARHWLDVVRFAETNGYERDAEKVGAWKYRDWVIGAANDDMPYDRFILEQLAGDELPDADEQTVIATGLLRIGPWDDEPNDVEAYRYERLEDLVHVASTAFLGLTVKCARCHDHKFDPIPQTDYYRLAAAFWPGHLSGWGPGAAQLGYDVLGWTDVTTDPTPLRVLAKGDPARPLHAARPGSLTCMPRLAVDFPPAAPGARTTGRRLGLARWIADPANPLTSRVIVNRLWQRHFGEGLCANPDNLGFHGPPPLHAELLDWLARDLTIHGWRLKRTHRLMVTSAAYKRRSIHPAAERPAARDPSNRLLWRAARRRLDAESIRDSALAASGELDRRVGGPSFREIIAAEALEGLSMKGEAYAASPLEERRRRSLYMFSKRSLSVPMMTAFDACDTTAPAGRREASIVPTQALTLLNSPWIRQRSAAFAERVVARAADPEARIDEAWRRALGRLPTAAELAAARAWLDAERQAAPAEALPAHDRAAWTALCQTLLNANEFLFLD